MDIESEKFSHNGHPYNIQTMASVWPETNYYLSLQELKW